MGALFSPENLHAEAVKGSKLKTSTSGVQQATIISTQAHVQLLQLSNTVLKLKFCKHTQSHPVGDGYQPSKEPNNCNSHTLVSTFF